MTPAREVFDLVSPHVGHSGSCSEKEFIKAVNSATSTLWRRGDWRGSEVYGRICTNDCYFVLPWEWQVIRDAWRGKFPIPVRDQWFEALTNVGIRSCCDCNCFGEMVDTGRTTATAFSHHNGWNVRAEFQCEDKTVRIVGRDSNGVTQSEELKDGEKTEKSFSSVESVVKPETTNPVLLYSVDPYGEKDDKFLAMYHPKQINPRMPVYKILGKSCESIVVRAKKRFVPISSLDDFLLIDNVTALQFAVQALNHQGKENALYVENINLAEESLNEDIEDSHPESFVPIEVELSHRTENLMPSMGYRYSHGGRI